MFVKCIVFSLLLKLVACKLIGNNVTPRYQEEDKMQTYEKFITTSQLLDQEDHHLVKKWKSAMQMQLLNITLHYRLQLSKYKERSFSERENKRQWKDCVHLNLNDLADAEQRYRDQESECITSSTQLEEEKYEAVERFKREIHKWRRTYLYSKKLCETVFQLIDEVKDCLTEFINEYYKEKSFNYNISFQLLLKRKMNAMTELYAATKLAVSTYETCLRRSLFQFKESVKLIVHHLNICYDDHGLSEFLNVLP